MYLFKRAYKTVQNCEKRVRRPAVPRIQTRVSRCKAEEIAGEFYTRVYGAPESMNVYKCLVAATESSLNRVNARRRRVKNYAVCIGCNQHNNASISTNLDTTTGKQNKCTQVQAHQCQTVTFRSFHATSSDNTLLLWPINMFVLSRMD